MLSRIFSILGLLLLSPAANAFVNGDFESGNLAGWTVTRGFNTFLYPGSQFAVTVTAGFAPNTNNNLNEIYQGNYACKLVSGAGDLNHEDWIRISQSDTISASNAILQFNYAAVLDGSHQFTPNSDAYVQVDVLGTTTTIYSVQYSYASSPAPLVNDGIPNKRHLPWTQLYFDLSAYIGQVVTLQFTAYDCSQGGHDAIAYVDGFQFVPPSPTRTPSATITPTHTATPTITQTYTITPTHTFSPTVSPTHSITETHTITETFSATPSFSHSPTLSATMTASPTSTVTPSFSHSPTHSITLTPSHTSTITITLTPTPRPLILKLLPPSPNPTSEDYIWLGFYISVDSEVDIDIFTVSGEWVKHMDAQFTREGYAERKWELRNDAGNKVASGTYIYRVRAISGKGEVESDFSKCAVIR